MLLFVVGQLGLEPLAEVHDLTPSPVLQPAGVQSPASGVEGGPKRRHRHIRGRDLVGLETVRFYQSRTQRKPIRRLARTNHSNIMPKLGQEIGLVEHDFDTTEESSVLQKVVDGQSRARRQPSFSNRLNLRILARRCTTHFAPTLRSYRMLSRPPTSAVASRTVLTARARQCLDPFPQTAIPEELRRLYTMEKRLADRLRAADATDRAELYGEVYDRYFQALPESPRPSAEQTVLQKRLIAPFAHPETVFLEIGSGDGALARSLAPDVGEVWTIEASTVAAGAVPTPTNFHHVLPKDADRRISEQSIDLAFSCHFLEHLHPEDLIPHLSQVLRWLKPGAPYVTITPNRLHGPHDVSGYFSDAPEGFHLREYCYFDLAAAFKQAGFPKVEALFGVGRDPVRWPVWPVRLVEVGLELAGPAFRRRLFDRWLVHQTPLRPLEQVKIVGWKR